MSAMLSWFQGLEPSQQVFWGCAILSSAFFLVQMVLSFIGIDADLDVDMDADAGDVDGGFSLISVKSVINFFVGFGWAGVCLAGVIPSYPALLAVAILVGLLFVGLVFFLIKKMMRLEHVNNFDAKDCEGCIGEVYLRIPAAKTSTGKVQVSVKGSVHELPALTVGEALASGRKVKVVSVLEGGVLLVESI